MLAGAVGSALRDGTCDDPDLRDCVAPATHGQTRKWQAGGLSQNERETVGDGQEEEEEEPEQMETEPTLEVRTPLRVVRRSTISRATKKPTSQSPPGKRSRRTGTWAEA